MTEIDPARQIVLELTVAQAEQILGALGGKPYVEVAELITSVQEQATRQLADEPAPDLPLLEPVDNSATKPKGRARSAVPKGS